MSVSRDQARVHQPVHAGHRNIQLCGSLFEGDEPRLLKGPVAYRGHHISHCASRTHRRARIPTWLWQISDSVLGPHIVGQSF